VLRLIRVMRILRVFKVDYLENLYYYRIENNRHRIFNIFRSLKGQKACYKIYIVSLLSISEYFFMSTGYCSVVAY
jgi:hypothetical protein